MSSKTTEKPHESAENKYFQNIVDSILVRLRDDPRSLTTEDARRLSENAVADDTRMAKIISAVEGFAVANEVVHDVDTHLGHAPHTSLPTLINDLKVAVEQNPADVTTEVLRTAQNVVSKMQRAVGHTNAPHPELETQLKEEIAKIEPKVAKGTVTIEEANRLHSLEARAHGHTERGGITSIAQSVAAKRERQISLSSGSSPPNNRSRANSKAFTPGEQPHRDKEANLHVAQDAIKPKIEQGTATEADAKLLQFREARAHGDLEKGSMTASAQSIAPKKRQDSFSDKTNISTDESKQHKEQSHHDREVNIKLAEVSLEPKLEKEPEKVTKEDAANVQSREQRAHGHVEKRGRAAQATALAHKRQMSQPTVEVN